jgi:3-isopropylmalate/(R)-2-methylmalate dehydratase small subunit
VEPFVTVTGTMCPVDRDDIDTDQIIPAQFMKRIERTGYGEFLFNAWRKQEGFPLDDPRRAGATVLVAGKNFGCGSSREHAPWAIGQAGFRVVIAESFADIFRNNCGKNGLLTVTLPEPQVRALLDAATADPSVSVRVDLDRQVVTTPDGAELPFEIDATVRERLMKGLDDIAITLAEADLITKYEAEREREGPVTTAIG